MLTLDLRKLYPVILALLSGVLLGLSWLPGLTFLIFIALVPFFVMENLVLNSKVTRKNNYLFWLAYLTFFTWNVIDTWWVCYASLGGAAMAIFANALLMALTYRIYIFASRRIKSNYRILLLIPFWIFFEHFHTDWDLSWTWLTLGNVFAFKTEWIQWYEYTGVSGGTLWILLVNCLVFLAGMEFKNYQNWKKVILVLAIIIVVYAPTQISEYVLEHYLVHSPSSQNVKSKSVKTVIVQPSFDAYTEKFQIPFPIQFDQSLSLIRDKVDSTTDYLVFPETFVPHQQYGDEIYENNMNGHPYLALFFDSLLSKYPQLTVVTGADTDYQYDEGEERLPTAREYAGGQGYYESFNSGIQLRVGKPVDVYHKSKLVPGVEMMPFPRVLGWLADLAIEMGGTSGSLGRQDYREVFDGPKGAKAGIIICYESVFGEYVTEYVRKGANILFIITNDGWWEDTPGYKQHLAYGALRAIETRRYIGRSANTGISCIIDDSGQIHNPAGWFERKAVDYTIPLIEYQSFFVKHGDYIARIMRWFAVGGLILGSYLWWKEIRRGSLKKI